MAPRTTVVRIEVGFLSILVGLGGFLAWKTLSPKMVRAQPPVTSLTAPPQDRTEPLPVTRETAASPATQPAPEASQSTSSAAETAPSPAANPAPGSEGLATWKNSQGIEFVRVEAGEFMMGTTSEQVEQFIKLFPKATPKDLDAEQPAHVVQLTKPFEISRYKVTVAQFHAFVGETGYPADPDADRRAGATPRPWSPQPENHPMVNVSWNDARAFCEWLSAKEGGKVKYRLPTEAEWEYACRAGTRTLFPNGDDPENLALIGNVADASARKKYPGWTWTIEADDGHVFASPVGIYAPNAWGLYDMIGNVWEWCEDNYDHDYYNCARNEPCVDPSGPTEAPMRSVRGSCWFLDVKRCRPADRGGFPPTFKCGFLGFRLVALREE